MKYVKLLLIGLITMLSIMAISGCGTQAGDEFVGTWKLENSTPEDISYLVISKSNNNLLITNYHMYVIKSFNYSGNLVDEKKSSDKIENIANLSNNQLSYKETIMILDKNILKLNNKGTTINYEKVSDSPKTFNELNTDGYPEPK